MGKSQWGTLGVRPYQHRLLDCNKCTTLVEDVTSGVGRARVGATGMWEISVLSASFCSEPKTALKYSL